MAKQFNGRFSLFQSIGRHASWYVPAVLAVASVATAPAGQQMRTFFQEGFGVLAMITRHFSENEIRQAKWFAISGLMFVIHGVFYYIFLHIWPEVFGSEVTIE